MNALLAAPFLALFGQVGVQDAPQPHPLVPESPAAATTDHFAHGNFTQTGITSIQTRMFGPITVIDQTSFGVVTGTIDGTFTDSLRVVILPTGSFYANFTLNVDGTVQGQQGSLTLRAFDIGRIVGPTTAEIEGVAVVTGGTGGLDGMSGVLRIGGTVDLVSGLSSYDYAGFLDDGN